VLVLAVPLIAKGILSSTLRHSSPSSAPFETSDISGRSFSAAYGHRKNMPPRGTFRAINPLSLNRQEGYVIARIDGADPKAPYLQRTH